MASMKSLGVLIFSATASDGYRHSSIPAGITALRQLAAGLPGVSVTTETTEDPTIFERGSLSRFKVVVLLQTSGDFLSPGQLSELQRFVQGGGGVVAIHGASTGMPKDEWYCRLIGAAFKMHPEPQQGVLHIVDDAHPIVSESLGQGSGMASSEGAWRWHWFDEWYNFTAEPSRNVHVLMTVDERSYAGGTHGEHHPIAWCQEFEGGRCFYTALGHFDEAYQDPGFLSQLRGAILWTATATATTV